MGKAAGWLVAAVMLVAAIGAFFWGLGQKRLADDLDARLAAANQASAAMKKTVDEMGARVDEAAREVRDLEARVEKVQQADAAAAAVSPPAEGAQGAEALKAMMQALQKPPEEGAAGAKGNPFAAMFSGEQGKNMARMSAQMSIPTMYGGLFKELNLPPETEAEVREMMIDSLSEQVTQGFDAMNAKGDPEEMRKNMEAQGKKLRDQLATVLTADELAVFDEYEANKERRMLESGIDVQLSMFAQGLTEENRTAFRDVIVEEMTAQGGWMNNPEVYANPGGAIDRQIAAFHAARDRMAPTLDAGQAAEVEAFVRQMDNVMNAQRQFVETMMNRGAEEGKKPE